MTTAAGFRGAILALALFALFVTASAAPLEDFAANVADQDTELTPPDVLAALDLARRAEPDGTAIPPDAEIIHAPNLNPRCTNSQWLNGQVTVIPSATFAVLKYALKKPVKLTTVQLSPLDAPAQTFLGIGASVTAKTNFTIRVNNLEPGKTYTVKINAPDPSCPGVGMIIGNPVTPVVKTFNRRVVFTVKKIHMTDDSDAVTCGDFSSFQALFRLASVTKNGKVVDHVINLVPIGGDTGICSGDNYFPINTAKTANKKVFGNVVDTTFSVGFGAIDDDTSPFELATYGLQIAWGSNPQSGQFDQANKVWTGQAIPGVNANDVPGEVTKTYTVAGDVKFEATLNVKTTFTKQV